MRRHRARSISPVGVDRDRAAGQVAVRGAAQRGVAARLQGHARENEENLTLRIDEMYNRHWQKVQQTGRKRYGIKELSYITHMVLQAPVRSTCLDLMHLLFLGILKSLMTLWFDKSFRDKNYSLYECVNIVNNFLESIKPHHLFQRCPQSLKKKTFWKAAEYQFFFFLYSLPILRIVIRTCYAGSACGLAHACPCMSTVCLGLV